MTIEDVNKLSSLARIEMSDEEKAEFLGNMQSILGYVDQIKNADIDGVDREVGTVRNVLREDGNINQRGAYTEKILAQMPETENGFLKVKQILS